MDDPVPVGEAEGFEHLERVRDRVADRKRTAGEDELFEAAPLDDFHGDVVRALGLAAVVDRDDVGMGKRRGRLRLAPKTFDEELVVGIAVVQNLDRDAPAEILVLREVDVRHAA